MKTVRKSLMFLLGTMILSIAQVAEGGDGKGGGREPGPKPGSKQGPKPGIKGERKRGGPVREDFVASYDRNKDGKISFEEFRTARKTAALEEEGRRRLFNHLDKNKDGTITPNELPKAMPHPVRDSDLDRNGRISFEEFRRSARLKGVREERIKAMFSRMDHNKDRFLTPQDFRRRGGLPFGRAESDKLDTDRDHALSFREWMKSPRHKGTPEGELRRRFNMLDRNKDGKLDDKDRDRGRGEGSRPGPRHHPPRRESEKP
ncbi:MAG: EF-hand domain-containing protein [Roseibacillus sp.]|nr:EF-hand domain-containing protein [Roseibacillus sp.]